MNDGISTRLWCQNSEEIEEALEDSAMMFFYTRGLALLRKMVTLHPTWWTVIKANKLTLRSANFTQHILGPVFIYLVVH